MYVLIKHWRKMRQMTQEDLAALVGISQPTLSRLENGEVPVTLETLSKCARALEIPLEQLYSVAPPHNGQEHAHG